MLENFRKHKHGSIIAGRLRYYCFRIVEKFCLGNCSTYGTVYKMSCTKRRNTRWVKYDRDWLCVNKSQFVPVILEPPCTFGVSIFRLIRTGTGVVTETGVHQGSQRAYHAQLWHATRYLSRSRCVTFYDELGKNMSILHAQCVGRKKPPCLPGTRKR
jgi:hypothetical protein